MRIRVLPFAPRQQASACGRFFPASRWQWHRWRGRAISRRDEVPQAFGWQKTSCCSSWMSEWFQEVGCHENWNFVQFEAKKPGCLGRIEAGGNNLPTEKFGLF